MFFFSRKFLLKNNHENKFLGLLLCMSRVQASDPTKLLQSLLTTPTKSNSGAYIKKVLVVHDVFNAQVQLAISELFQALNVLGLRLQQRTNNAARVELKYEKAEDQHEDDGEVK